MDIIDILITVGFFLFFAIIGSKKKTKNTKPSTSEPSYDSGETDNDLLAEVESFFKQDSALLNKVRTKYSENEEIFTYENESPPVFNYEESHDDNWIIQEKTVLQAIESEEENEGEFTFDQNEIYKGIIYGEILKRPHY